MNNLFIIIMYFAFLDFLRFLSSLAVFFHHTFVFHYGKLGVYLFFIVSGFVIHFSLRKGVKDFIIGRFIRLYPLFWLCCTVTFLITFIYGVNVPVYKYFLDMLMLNDGKIATMVDGSYWTLTFELLFYVYAALFVSFFSVKRMEWFYILWLAISFLSFIFKLDQYFVVKLLSVRFAPYFVFGGMLALFVDRYNTSTKNAKAVYLGVLVVAAFLPLYISDKLRAQVGLITNFTGSFEKDEMLIVESFFIIMPTAVLLSYANFVRKENFKKLAVFLGGITYPLYLLHWKIGDTIITHYGHSYGKVTLFSVVVASCIFSVATLFSLGDSKVRRFFRSKFLGRHQKDSNISHIKYAKN